MSFIFRAYHAMQRSRPMSTRAGLPTAATYVFVNMIRKLREDFSPRYFAAIFDPSGAVFRDERAQAIGTLRKWNSKLQSFEEVSYEGYKAKREAMPDDLRRQVPYIRRSLEALRIPILEVQGFEADDLIAKARRILKPYTLDVREIAWWSVYEIGQRLCDKFDDVPADEIETRLPRVFIAGDACHTHSPKAGQGMNVSMQDTFTLGWKLASVLRKRSAPHLLHTYSAERQAIAREYSQTVDRLIGSGSWDEMPGPEDQLPDAWMPKAFFEYWSPQDGRS